MCREVLPGNYGYDSGAFEITPPTTSVGFLRAAIRSVRNGDCKWGESRTIPVSSTARTCIFPYLVVDGLGEKEYAARRNSFIKINCPGRLICIGSFVD